MADAPVALGALLKEADLAHVYAHVEAHEASALASLLAANRVAFLSRLKEWGVSSLADRQRLANALARAAREGRVRTVRPVSYLVPALWSQTDDTISVRMRVPGGTPSHAISFKLDANSLEVSVSGERTVLHGRLAGLVKTADSTWELARAGQDEPAPFESAASRELHDDAVVVTLAKSRPVEWRSLFAGGDGASARREKTAEPTPASAVRAAAPAVGGASPLAFKQRTLRLGAAKERHEARHEQARADAAGAGGADLGTLSAREHWQDAAARYLWRDSAPELRRTGPGEPPWFAWTESAASLVLRAPTRRGLAESALRLSARPTSVDLEIDGAPTPWCGALVGRVDPCACTARIVRNSSASHPDDDGDGDVLELVLAKAGARLWRAPFAEMISEIDAIERRRVRLGREAFRPAGGGEWRCAQTHEWWEVHVPIRWGVAHADEWRVAVTPRAFSVHVAGLDEAPFLAGETVGPLIPDQCMWAMHAPAEGCAGEVGGDGDAATGEIEIRLRKDTSRSTAHWKDLLRNWYV